MAAPSSRTPRFLALALLLSACHSDPASSPGWGEAFSVAAIGITPPVIAVGPSDHLAISGQFLNGVHFDRSALNPNVDDNVVIAVLNPSGSERFHLSCSDSGLSSGNGVAEDSSGTTIVAGSFSGTLPLADGPVTALSTDTFVAAFSWAGVNTWSRHLSADLGGVTGVGTSTPQAGVAVDASGEIAVAGTFTGTFGLGGAPLDALTQFDEAAFVGKLDDHGRHLWSLAIGTDHTEAHQVAVDPGGGVIVSGVNASTVQIGHTALPGGDAGSTFVASFSRTGDPRWALQIDGASATVIGLATDPLGNAIIAGSFRGKLGIGGRAFDSGLADAAFVASLSPSGEVRWAKTLGSGAVHATALAVDAMGTLAIAGFYSGAPDLGGGALPEAESALFVLELDAEGKHLNDRSFIDANASAMIDSLAFASDGSLRVAGILSDSLELGDSTISAPMQQAFFLAKLPR